jgi:hypothetical protein
LIQISQSPFRVASKYARGTGLAAGRAREVLDFLTAGPSKKQWSEITAANSTVATSLSKFGPEVTARLIYHGYVVAMCNLHVFFGEGYPLFPEELAIERFRQLIK